PACRQALRKWGRMSTRRRTLILVTSVLSASAVGCWLFRGEMNRRLLRAADRDELPIDGYLRLGADPNCRDEHGDTPLFLAARHGYRAPELIPMLIRAGADPDVRNKRGQTLFDVL